MNHVIEATRFSMRKDQMIMESINHNIANLHTPAYKRQIMENNPFVHILETSLQSQFSQGSLKETGNPLHLALTDKGFFQVQNENGVFYTRRGDFMINAKGEICTKNGDILIGNHTGIQVGANDFIIHRNGDVFIDNQKVDHIAISKFTDPENLQYLGDGLYKAIDSPITADLPLFQGYLEESNVNTIDEMAHLMRTSRHFELNQRILKTADSMISTAITHLGENYV